MESRWIRRVLVGVVVFGLAASGYAAQVSAKSTPCGATGATPTATRAVASSPGRFPLHVVRDRRHLVDAKGKPFLVSGDAAWSLIVQLSLPDARVYLKSRKANGFNTILVNLVEHEYATRAPANISGQRPFLGKAFTNPNPAYFKHADAVLKSARDLGFLVLLAPAYAGYDGGSEGWYQEMVAAGSSRLRSYGQWVGRRYAHLDNIIWVQGGDYDVPDQRLVDAVAGGIRSSNPRALQTYHGGRGDNVYKRWAKRSWFSIGTVYTDTVVSPSAQAAYRASTKPFLLIEAAYENDHGTTSRVLRRQAYSALLNGSTGQVFGNSPMWHFGSRDGQNTAWRKALASPGTRSMRTLSTVMSSLPWWQLCPDLDHRFVRNGYSGANGVVGAITRDRRLAVAYVPTSREVTIGLSGPRSASTFTWRDPVDGHTATARPVRTGKGTATFRTPGRNAGGQPDWLLVTRTR